MTWTVDPMGTQVQTGGLLVGDQIKIALEIEALRPPPWLSPEGHSTRKDAEDLCSVGDYWRRFAKCFGRGGLRRYS